MAAVIKKRRYLPKYIPGDFINEYMEHFEIVECVCLLGTMEHINYHVFCTKDHKYVMKIMSTYGGLVDPPRQRKGAVRTLPDGNQDNFN